MFILPNDFLLQEIRFVLSWAAAVTWGFLSGTKVLRPKTKIWKVRPCQVCPLNTQWIFLNAGASTGELSLRSLCLFKYECQVERWAEVQRPDSLHSNIRLLRVMVLSRNVCMVMCAVVGAGFQVLSLSPHISGTIISNTAKIQEEFIISH